MEARKLLLKFGVLIFFILTLSTSCSQNSAKSAKERTPISLANPAAEKCIKDGYTLSAILENEIPVGHWCEDSLTRNQCEIWDYYRGNCFLQRSGALYPDNSEAQPIISNHAGS